MKNLAHVALLALTMTTISTQLHAQQADVPGAALSDPILLWPNGAPDLKAGISEEKETTPPDPNKPDANWISRIGNVTKPTITVFRPALDKVNGAAVVVCPGGGYNILAYNLEGSEICGWLNSIGVTAILLKYRVPGRLTDQYRAPLQDAQRALGLVRSRAKEWNIDPKRVGILGFSAGGHLSAAASTNYATRAYAALDDADKESCKPDFSVLIYPAYLTTSDLTKLAPEIKVDAQTPPAFIAMTADDPIRVENAIVYSGALHAAGVSTELHVYPKGGHGYGLRPSTNEVANWPKRAADWLKSQGWLKAK